MVHRIFNSLWSQIDDICRLEWCVGIPHDPASQLQSPLQESAEWRLWITSAGNHLLHQLHNHQLHDCHQHVHRHHPGELQPGAPGRGDWHRRGRPGNVLHSLVQVSLSYASLTIPINLLSAHDVICRHVVVIMQWSGHLITSCCSSLNICKLYFKFLRELSEC